MQYLFNRAENLQKSFDTERISFDIALMSCNIARKSFDTEQMSTDIDQKSYNIA